MILQRLCSIPSCSNTTPASIRLAGTPSRRGTAAAAIARAMSTSLLRSRSRPNHQSSLVVGPTTLSRQARRWAIPAVPIQGVR